MMSDLFAPVDRLELDRGWRASLPGYPAAWSPERPALYRYTLWRVWNPVERPRFLMVVGLNPSTADETKDDPTIRRCIGFAKAWGFDALCMTNLFAWRDTDPTGMKAAADPVGVDNDGWLREVASRAGLVLAAWGVHGSHMGRAAAVCEWLPKLHALGFTNDGAPRHPLYMPKSATPVPFGAPRAAPGGRETPEHFNQTEP